MSTRLDKILDTTRATVAAAKARVPLADLEQRAALHQPRGWASALRSRSLSDPAVIAEIKRASPSKGLIREDFDVAWLARKYQDGGAAALSVLTDEPYFQGSLRNLEIASSATNLPCLRKDFIVDEYQIVEARAHCADAILLIAAALTSAELSDSPLRPTHRPLMSSSKCTPQTNLSGVLDALGENGADAIGVNNRDLKTFEVRMETSLELADRIPSSRRSRRRKRNLNFGRHRSPCGPPASTPF